MSLLDVMSPISSGCKQQAINKQTHAALPSPVFLDIFPVLVSNRPPPPLPPHAKSQNGEGKGEGNRDNASRGHRKAASCRAKVPTDVLYIQPLLTASE